MHIENPEALKGWLTVNLAPLCDADPAALARYVLALLKKGKPEKELQATMQDQLDVFLGAETQPFLDRLMHAIRSEAYLKPHPDSDSAPSTDPVPVPVAASSQPHSQSTTTSTTNTSTKEDQEDDALRITDSGSISGSGGHSPIKAPVDSTCPSSGGSSSAAGRRTQRLSARSRTRSRSRSPINERRASTRNSRDSRDRQNRPTGAYGRNKSPPGRRFEHHSRRLGKGSAGERYSRRNQSRSRSRSHSPPYRKSSRSLSPNHNQPPGQSMDAGDCRVQSQVVVTGQQQQQQKGKKCRDFEEKGYCMRGETCPWDHGVDPVVLEDINNPTLMTIQQQQQHHLREYNPDAPDLWARNAVGGGFGGPRGGPPGRNGGDFHGPPHGQRLPFRLSSGQVVGGQMMPGGLSQLNRELIPVPVMMDGQPVGPPMVGGGGEGAMMAHGPKRRYEDQNQPVVPGMEGPPKRRPLAGRLGGRVGPGGGAGGGNGGGAAQNCSLELRKVPRGLNSIAHLNNHFSKFGKIINIQVNYENDPEAAIVTFSSHAEANVAYRSTEAVLNNRFIKVFWHNNNNNNNNNGAGGKECAEGAKEETQSAQVTGGVRKGNQYHLNNVLNKQKQEQEKQEPNAAQGEKEAPSAVAPVAVVASPAQLRLRTNRGQALRKKQEEQVKAAVQMAQDLVKKKHDLLQEYLKQMRSCLELIEKLDAVDPQRAKLLQTLKELQGSIEKLRKEIADEQKQLAAVQQQHGTKEQQQKELLDLELELIAQQQEGNDVTHIQRRIHELQRALGRGGAPFNSRGGGGGGLGAGARGRVAPHGSTSVDRRPTTIFVAGFKVEDSDAVLGHFKHFGEITKNVLDQNIPSLIISFAVRTHAEQAMQRGRIFKEKPLQINWYIPNFVKQRQPEEQQQQQKQGEKGSAEGVGDKSEPVEAEGAPETTTPPMSTAAEIKEDEEEEEEAMHLGMAGATVTMTVAKTEEELEDELIGGVTGEELPSAAGDDELRLDDDDDDLEDRSWRR